MNKGKPFESVGRAGHLLSAASFSALLRGAAVLGVLLSPFGVQAQTVYPRPTVTATQNVECAGSSVRTTSALGCTAGEFVVSTSFDTGPGTPPFCTVGQPFTADVQLVLSGSNTDRYNIAFFTGEKGNDPRLSTTKAQGASCSGAIMPVSYSDPSHTPPNSLFYSADGNACGDLPKTQGVQQPVLIKGMKVACVANPATPTSDNLGVPYVLTYSQSLSGPNCTIFNVENGTTSKCNAGTATLTVNTQPIRVAGYVDITKVTAPGSDTTPFTFTATGASGSFVGSSVNGAAISSNNSTSNTFTLKDGETARVYMSVLSTGRNLTITESATNGWSSTANIACTNVTGAPPTTINNASRTVTATLNTTNSALSCTVTNTKGSKVTLNKTVAGRVTPDDQFTVSASGGGTLTDASGTAVIPAATTTGTGTGTGTSITFYSTPGQPITLTEAMSGTATPLSAYESSLSCTNARTGATTPLPTNELTTSRQITPQGGDDLTCTFTNTPRPMITLNKTIATTNGGRVASTDQFTLNVGSSSVTTQGSGSTVTAGTGSVTGIGTAGTAINLSETAAGTTKLAAYLSSIACTNSNTGSSTVLPSGSGRTFTITPRNNDVIRCTLTNTNNAAALTATKTTATKYTYYRLNTAGTTFIPLPRTLSYTVTVTAATGTASNVFVFDTLPSGVTSVSVRDSAGNPVALTDSGGSALSNPASAPLAVVRWSAGNLNSAESKTFTVTLSLPDLSAPGVTAVVPAVHNTVTVSADNVLDTTSLAAVTDIVLTVLKKTVQNLGPANNPAASPAAPSGSVAAAPGDVLRYCITASNWGSVALNNYTIRDTVPANSEYVGGSATLTPSGTPSYSAGVVTGAVGTLASGASPTLCFNTKVT